MKKSATIGFKYVLCGLIIASLALLLLWVRTRPTFNPEEKVTIMTNLSKEYLSETSLYSENEKITVRGQLLTEDGELLPMTTGENCQGKFVKSIDIRLKICPDGEMLKPNLDGTFEFQTQLKRFYIIAEPQKEYAVGHFGPFEFDPNEAVDGLVLTLKRGFPAKIQFIDEHGEPVANAAAMGGYPEPPRYDCWYHSIKAISDNNGIAAIERSSDYALNLTCEASGYVKESKQKIKLNPKEPYIWQLTSAPQTKIKVISDVNEQPIDGAAVCLHGKDYWQIDSHYLGNPPLTTNNQGVAELKSLNKAVNYTALIYKKGYQRQYREIKGGDDVVVRLKDFRPIKGKIVGDINDLKKDEKGRYFVFSNVVRTNNHSRFSDWSGDNKVYIKQIGEETHFQIDKYYGHNLDITIGSQNHTIDIEKDDIENIVIAVPEKVSYQQKDIILNFVDAVTSNTIAMNGKLKLAYKDPNDNCLRNHEIDVVDGKAKIQIQVPNQISWQPSPQSSWFFYQQWEDISAEHGGIETIKCYPAGAIYGRITNSSKEFTRVYLNIITVKESPLLEKNKSQHPVVEFDNNIEIPDGSYYIAPLPLDGEYAVTVSSENMLWVSDRVKLSQRRPIYELNISLPTRLADIKGQLLDPNGNPAAGVPFYLNRKTQYGGNGVSNSNFLTDNAGRFEIKEVNPDSSIKYSITFTIEGFARKQYDVKIDGANRIILEGKLEQAPIK